MINVVCAVVCDEQGRVMACRRGPGQSMAGKWEFPGGKVEPGEGEVAALQRELREELSCELEVGRRMLPVEHRYPDFGIRLIPYHCRRIDAGACQLHEHDALRWVTLDQLAELDWADADVPVWRQLLAAAGAD